VQKARELLEGSDCDLELMSLFRATFSKHVPSAWSVRS
jgi:hypothetical protein